MSLDKTIVEALLAQVKRLQQERAALAQRERRDFNIFTLLRPEDDEVNLHSRFLFELLNPQGTHGMGAAFLELFLTQAGLESFDATTATLKREYQSMDIFIADRSRQAVILENKLYAPDQPGQLQRYYKAVRKGGYKNVVVLYLSLYGDPPGEKSVGNLDEEVVVLSYADDVHDWLATCIDAAAAYPVVRETLVQYQWLVEKLTGQAGGRLLMDIKALLRDEEALIAAINIGQALTEVKIDLQFAFWLRLEEKLKKAGFDSIEYVKYSRKKVEAYYKKGRRDHGLVFPLPELLGQETLAFYIGININRVYYGFIVLEDGHSATKESYPGFVLLSEILKGVDEKWTVGKYLIGWKYSKRQIEFSNFDTPDTLALIDPAKRDAYLDELVEEITVAIDQFYTACEKDLRLKGDLEW